MTKTAAVLFGALSIMLLSAKPGITGDVKAGKAKATVTCAACHGVDGNSLVPTNPSLAGQKEAFIVEQLKAFKSGARKSDIMQPMAAPLSDQEIQDLAAYFASQKAKPAKGTT